MDDMTRREAIRLAAATGVAATGMVMAGAAEVDAQEARKKDYQEDRKKKLTDLAKKNPLTDPELKSLSDAQILRLMDGVVHNGWTLNSDWVFNFDLPAGKQATVTYAHGGVNEQEPQIVDIAADTRVSSSNNYSGRTNVPIGPFQAQKRYAVFAHFKYGRPSGRPWNQAPGRVIQETATHKEYGFEDNYVNQNFQNIIVTIDIA